MGNLASKVKGDSPHVNSSSHPWSSAPCGSWVIRLSPAHPTQNPNTMKEIKGLPIYHWSSPDWITGDIFNNLMFVVVQIFLEGNPNRLVRLIEEPLEAAEMIAQFNTFVESTNQDMRELRHQLLEAAHESIQLHVEDEQLVYLDLLVTSDFDPGYEVRSVISRKNRSSKSSLLRSFTSTIKSKVRGFKKKRGRQASHNNPAKQPSRTSCGTAVVSTPLRPTAPGLSEFNKRTETVTSNIDVDNTDEICITAVLDSSNNAKDNDKKRDKTESTRKLEEKNAVLKLPSSSSSLFTTSETITSLSTHELSLDDELITKQKDVCWSKVSQEESTVVYSSLTGVTETTVIFQPKEPGSSDKQKNAGEGSCVQEDSGEHVDGDGQVSDSVAQVHTYPGHTWLEELGEQQDSNNCGPVFDNVPSGPKQDEPSEHSHDDGPVCGNVPLGPKQAESSEHCHEDSPVCGIVSSGQQQAESSEHSHDDGPLCGNVPPGPKQAEPSAHSLEDGLVGADSSTSTRHAESNKEKGSLNPPVLNDFSPGAITADSSDPLNNNDPVNAVAPPAKHPSNPFTFLPIYGRPKSRLRSATQPASSGLVCLPFHGLSRVSFTSSRQGESTEAQSRKRKLDNSEEDKLAAKRVKQDNISGEAEESRDPSTPKHDESNEHSDNHDPASVTDSAFNDPPLGTILADSTTSRDNPVSVTAKAPKDEHPSKASMFLPIYGLSKSYLRSTTQLASTKAQGKCANMKEENVSSSKPSSSGLVCLPFHGLSRASFSPRPQQGEPTGVLTRKRKADIGESKGSELPAKRLKQEDMSGEAEENRNPCHSRGEGDKQQCHAEINSKRNTVDDDGNDSNSSDSEEWHDALEDTEP